MSSSLATAHNQVSFKVFGFLLNLAHCILCVAMLPFFRFAIVTIVGIVLALDPELCWGEVCEGGGGGGSRTGSRARAGATGTREGIHRAHV